MDLVKGEVVRTVNAASDCVDPILLPHCSRAGNQDAEGLIPPWGLSTSQGTTQRTVFHLSHTLTCPHIPDGGDVSIVSS